MGDIVNLRSMPIDLNSDVGHAFIQDATRAGEGLISDEELREKYELSPADWATICKDKNLGNKIRAERERRVRSGQAAREAAARHLVKGVGIVDGIMSSTESHPKHRLDAFRELRSTAAVGVDGEGRQDNSRFVIHIDMTAGGGPIESFDKDRAPMQVLDISIEDGVEGKRDDQW